MILIMHWILTKTFSSILLDLYYILGFCQCCNLHQCKPFHFCMFSVLTCLFLLQGLSLFLANKISSFSLTWDFPIFQKIDPMSSAQHFPLSIIWLENLGKPKSLAALIHCEIPKKRSLQNLGKACKKIITLLLSKDMFSHSIPEVLEVR